MTDLTAARAATTRMLSPYDYKLENQPLATGAVAYQGGGAAVDTSGNLVRASAATAVKTTGIFCATNASAASGDVIDVQQGIAYLNNGSAALTDADRFQPCYWEDDNTVGGDPTTLLAGIVLDVDSGGVWVLINPFLAAGAARTNKLIAGGAAYTLKDEDDGATIETATDNAVITLPNIGPSNEGMTFRVRCTAANGAAKVSISPHSSDKMQGGINGGAGGALVTFGGVADKDAILTKATALKGDYAQFQNDGVDSWYVVAGQGIWASEP